MDMLKVRLMGHVQSMRQSRGGQTRKALIQAGFRVRLSYKSRTRALAVPVIGHPAGVSGLLRARGYPRQHRKFQKSPIGASALVSACLYGCSLYMVRLPYRLVELVGFACSFPPRGRKCRKSSHLFVLPPGFWVSGSKFCLKKFRKLKKRVLENRAKNKKGV